MAKAWKKGVDVSVPVPGPPPTEPARVANEKNGSENIEDHDQEETAGDVSMSDDQAKEKPAADEDVPDDRDYSSDSSSSSGSESGDDWISVRFSRNSVHNTHFHNIRGFAERPCTEGKLCLIFVKNSLVN